MSMIRFEKVEIMSLAIERVVVQIAPADKKRISEKAKKQGIALSELMRRAAFAYTGEADDADLARLADAAKKAADAAIDSIDDAMSFIEQSNLRIAARERLASEARSQAMASGPLR
jgi:hypothetical protein